MKTYKKLLVALLAVICILCAVVTVSCTADTKKYYNVTFVDGDNVHHRAKVEMGKRLEFPDAPTRDDENYIFDGWYMDENAEKMWDVNVERVTKDVVLWSNFLYVSQEPGNITMDDSAFSSTVTWLQRGIDSNTEFSIKTRKGELISATDYVYSQELSNDETALNGASGGVTLTPYRNHNDVYTVSWTPSQIPQGGVYSVEITCANGTAKKDGLYFKGSGTQNNPYLLIDANDLVQINSANVEQGSYYKLQQSFNVKLIAKEIVGNTFDGYLDGNGKTITVDAGGSGLFGLLGENAVIEDLTVTGDIDAVENCVGVIANVNNGRIEYCTVSAGIKSSIGTVGKLEGDSNSITGGAGGLVGINNGTVVSCTYSGSARANVGAGGIAVINNGEITNCTYSGTLGAGNAVESGSSTNEMSYMGGIAAINYGKVELCSATGKLLAQRSMTGGGSNNNIGGIVAYNTADGVVVRCFTDSQRIYGNNNVGGIAGENSGAISYCYVMADHRTNISSHNYIGGSANVGGIVGLTNAGATVKNCYALANVYAYDGAAYRIAQSCENCVYLDGNLDDRDFTVINSSGETKQTTAKDFTLPEGNNNIAVELTASIKEEYKTKEYKLTLDETQFATLNGNEGCYKSPTNVTFSLASNIKERNIKVEIVLDGDNKNYTVSNVGNNITITVPDIDGKYVVGYALTPDGKVVFEEGKAIGYKDLAIFNRDTVTLYPVYRDGARPENTVLKIALWDRYVQEETVQQLINAFKASKYFNADFDVIITVLSSKDNTAYKADYDAGDYNVTFAYASQTLNSWQNTFIEISIFNLNSGDNGEYGILKVGLNSNDTVVKNFGEFLATNEAKKIMNPNYVEVTLYNGTDKLGVELVLSTDSLKLDTLDANDGYTFVGWALTATATEGETLFNKTVSYDTLYANAQDKALTLYARFVESTEVKENYTLKVALWSRYIQKDTLESLLNAYALSNFYKTEFQFTFTVLTSNNNSNFKKDYDNGDYNVTFAYASKDVDEWQGKIVEVYTYNVLGGSYGTLKVGLNSNDEVVVNFGLFLATDEAKKIMNPAYISEAEADTIEVTLMNGGAQYGDKLIVSNATETENKQIELPKITEIPEGYSTFEGWALTATATEKEKLLNGAQTYADLATYAKEGKLTLYARFVEDNDDGVDVIVIGYWSNYVTKDVADVIKEEFEKYLTDNEYTNFKVVMREYKQTKVAELVDAIQKDGDVDYFIGGGGNITTTKGTESKETLTTVGDAVTMTKRNIVQLTSTELADEFTKYSQTENAKIKEI